MTEKTPITMILTDPKGNVIKHAPPDVREIQDPTHHQFRVQNPLGGDWTVDLRTSCANYLFILSARSQTSMHLGFGLPPAERTVGAKIPILVVLADREADHRRGGMGAGAGTECRNEANASVV